MKRIIICCDGTWSTFDAKDSTNVVRFTEVLAPRGADGIENSIFYDSGVGTNNPTFLREFNRVASGIFGFGTLSKVADAYEHLIVNYNPGDKIYLLGASRGAFTVRSLAGLIRLCGIPSENRSEQIREAIDLYKARTVNGSPDDEKTLEFRAKYSSNTYISPADLAWREADAKSRNTVLNLDVLHKIEIDYIGVWDTVGALGIPKDSLGLSDLFNRNSRFHDTELSAIVTSARHAVAIDERRKAYEPTLWTNLDWRNAQRGFDSADINAPYQQYWFPGDHSGVIGGKPSIGFSHRALLWIIEGAAQAGLSFKPVEIEAIKNRIDFHVPLIDPNHNRLLQWIFPKKDREGPESFDDIDVSARLRWRANPIDLPEGMAYRPKPLHKFAAQLDKPDDMLLVGRNGLPILSPAEY